METGVRQGGFTLLELIVVVAVFVISVTVAIPSASHLIERTRADSARNDLVALMGYARSSAAEYRKLVTLCSLNHEGRCELPWSRTLAVFIDQNGDGQQDKEDQLLRIMQFEPANWAKEYRTAGRSFFQWNELALSNGTPGSVAFCHPDIKENRFAVIVSFAGRIRPSRDYDKDGVPERSPDTPVSCKATTSS